MHIVHCASCTMCIVSNANCASCTMHNGHCAQCTTSVAASLLTATRWPTACTAITNPDAQSSARCSSSVNARDCTPAADQFEQLKWYTPMGRYGITLACTSIWRTSSSVGTRRWSTCLEIMWCASGVSGESVYVLIECKESTARSTASRRG